jgi:hypothetical protein
VLCRSAVALEGCCPRARRRIASGGIGGGPRWLGNLGRDRGPRSAEAELRPGLLSPPPGAAVRGCGEGGGREVEPSAFAATRGRRSAVSSPVPDGVSSVPSLS